MVLRKNHKSKKVKTPVILQMEAVECGAASLAVILAHYGRYVTLEELRIECEVTRDGIKASNIVRAGMKYGLQSEGYTMETEDLKQMDFPVIIFWNFNHFLVVDGYKKGRFYINDPASGPRIVTEEEFNLSFTGVVLTFKPGDEFKKGGRKTSLFSMLGQWLKGSETAALFFVLLGLILIFPGIVIPIFSKIFVDDILIKGMSNWIMPLLIGMIFTAFLRGGLVWLQRKYLLRFEEKLAINSSAILFWHILKLPITFFSQRYGGEIGSRVAINNNIAQFLARNLAGPVLNFIMIGFYAAIMFYYDIFLTAVGIMIAGINIFFLYFISQRIKTQKLKLLQERGKLTGSTMSGLQIIESLKAGGSENDFFTKYASYHAKVINAEQKLNLASNILLVVPELLFGINTALILFIGSYRVMGGYLTMGMLVAFQSLMSSFIEPVNSLVRLGGTTQEMNGNVKRVEDIIKHPEDPQIERQVRLKGIPGKKLTGRIEVKNLIFGYGNRENLLIKGFNLNITQGSRVAIIGKSGSGKTTIARLIAGLYEPWEGEILFDNIARKDIPRAMLNNSISLVDQNIVMFEGTIKDNITLWDKTIPDADIINASKDALIHNVIIQKHGAYDYIIEEGGRNFSGGEKQRLEIARALVGNPSIIILDEATSALDPATEKRIDENIRCRGCTTLIIAHRLSTIRDCDEIIVLDKGIIVERGTHESLIRLNGYYSKVLAEKTVMPNEFSLHNERCILV